MLAPPPPGSTSGAATTRAWVCSALFSSDWMASDFTLKSFWMAARTSASVMPKRAERNPTTSATVGVGLAALGVVGAAATGAGFFCGAVCGVVCASADPGAHAKPTNATRAASVKSLRVRALVHPLSRIALCINSSVVDGARRLTARLDRIFRADAITQGLAADNCPALFHAGFTLTQ